MKTSAASLPALKTRRRYFEWRTVWLWVGILGACVGSGVFYGAVSEHGRTWIGAVYGLCCGGSVMLFEQGVVSRQFRERLRRLPWLLSILATEVVYVVMVMAGAMLAGLLLSALGLLNESLRDAVLLGPTTIIYSLAVSGVIVTLLRMRDLVGAETFRNILLGRYHYPAKEERIFVFVDLIGSTAYAQAHGDLEAQRYLGAIFTAMAEPVRRYGGAINDYIGDMAMLTWPLAAGAQEARCVACVFAFLDAITKDAETWRRDFGEVPAFGPPSTAARS